MLVPSVWQRDSIIYLHVSFFKVLFPFRLLQNTEQHSLCYTARPCFFSTLNMGVCPWAPLVAQMVKTLPAVQETQVPFLG